FCRTWGFAGFRCSAIIQRTFRRCRGSGLRSLGRCRFRASPRQRATAAELPNRDRQVDGGADCSSAGGAGRDPPLIGAGRRVEQIRGLAWGASTTASIEADRAATSEGEKRKRQEVSAAAGEPRSGKRDQ